jgi:cation diffusion facilitator family transporter
LDAILHRETFIFSWWLTGVALLTIILKSGLFIYTRNAGRREDNLLILANSEDHRNDVFVTSSTLLGIIFGSQGIYWIDGVVGIGISLWIAFIGIRIFSSSYHVLMDTTIDEALKSDIIKAIESINGVDHVDDVTAKPIGLGFIIIVKVSVKGDMTVREGHSIAAQIKQKVKGFKHAKDVLVHVNPA